MCASREFPSRPNADCISFRLATEIRYQLCEICLKLASRFRGEDDELVVVLGSLGAFVLETVQRDLGRGRQIALETGAQHSQLEGALHELRCSFMNVQYRLRNGIERGEIDREQALQWSQAERQQSFTTFQQFKTSLVSTEESKALLADWVTANIEPNVTRVHEQWLKFEKSIIAGEIFHKKVSKPEVVSEPEASQLEEIQGLVRAS